MAQLLTSTVFRSTRLDGSPNALGLVYFYAAGTLTPQATYTTPAGNVPNGNPVTMGADGTKAIWLADGLVYRVIERTASGELIRDTDDIGSSDLLQILGGGENGEGSGLIGYRQNGVGSVAVTVQSRLRQSISVREFGAATGGLVSATAAIQNAFNEAASSGAKEVYFPAGTYLITNPNNDSDYTCAIVISGLRNCVVRGAKGARFIVNGTGNGSPEFGMFRIEQCENVEFCGFELDGSGITVNGIGANRSRGFVLVNYDVNNKANALAVLNKGIEFHHIKASNIGGFVGVPPRSSALNATPFTDGLVVRDCIGANLIGQDHFVGVTYVRGLTVRNNRCVNDIVNYAPIDNMMVDVSQGCEGALVENNYAYGFWFGSKCETATGVGPSGTEIRPSRNVVFLNNTYEQIGNPDVFTIPGAAGGDTYGIKLNGINCKAIGNTISARTIGLTAGGLAGGIQALGTHAADSHCVVEDNLISGALYGINHNDTTPATRKSSYMIRSNRINDAITHGVILQSNVVAENNQLHRCGGSAILVQSPNNTAVRRNLAFNCATTDNAVSGTRVVFFQEGAGAYSGFQEWTDNVIIDERGASAAEHGYFIRGGTTYSNVLIFRPGYSSGLLTAVTVDTYVSSDGDSLQKSGTTAPSLRTVQVANNPASTAPWDGMRWNAGDRAVLVPPVVGSPKGWLCTVAGTPGTWVSEGNL